MDKYLAVAAGAGLGGVTRYALSAWIMWRFGGTFPLGTFAVNVSGSFLIGLISSILSERLHLHPNWRLFLVAGVLGGYTTFSTFAYETLQAMREGARWTGMLYAGGSVVAGYAAVWLGAVSGNNR